jgi:hypothetical protein
MLWTKAISFLASWTGIKAVIELCGFIFGILGTWLMSRRYARELWRNLVYAFLFPFLILVGKGSRVRDFVKATVNANRDVEDSVTDMTIGLHLLLWAFFLQLIALTIEVLS